MSESAISRFEVGTEVADCDRECASVVCGRGASGEPVRKSGGGTSSSNEKADMNGLLFALDVAEPGVGELVSLFVRPPQFNRME